MKQSVTQILDFFKKHKYGKLSLAILLLGMLIASAFLMRSKTQQQPIPLSEVASAISAGRVQRIEDSRYNGTLTIYFKDGTQHTTLRDTTAPFLEQMRDLGVSETDLAKLRYEIVEPDAFTGGKGADIFMSLAMLGLIGYGITRITGGAIANKKKYVEGDIPNVKFKDVAGIDETREELIDIVSFLKDNGQYLQMGARMPRGVLLVGDPGTGKTLLAKAIAGEAGVPFFSTAGSEFVEMFVGVGASRVRSLFKKARSKAPCIIFIDEIDAAGRKRNSSSGGGDMEADQTLNQLLVEMDGFTGDVNLMDVAKSTPGLVGADLASVVNEAAILAVRNGHQEISVQDFQEAVEKNLIGSVQQKNRVMSVRERRTIAYHEAGHAVVMHCTEHSDPVYKITIIPRGQMGGFTMSLPEQDSLLMSRNQLLAQITGLMGGRVAEEIFCDDITSGASNDLKVATQLAEEMVMRLGMSVTGLRVFNRAEGVEALAAPRAGQKTFEAMDQAISQILDECYAEAKRIIIERREAMERVTQCLLQQETLTREEFVALI